ncbi:hypothetical protein AB6735_27410 [Mucilaginibacter sp. RCC_168]|jgi:hypothetical protein|uniref:hypothetical protein n=1 Tax=unclassified Mucilaginibacter TaxID=2617802 RepID=UPI000880C61F|nr:hypothetical protein [Mucilaginibacter sp. OK268]SDP85896.1 hypothetical protein SAMN05428975_3077 [Mucilaginibacter sp. OK268]
MTELNKRPENTKPTIAPQRSIKLGKQWKKVSTGSHPNDLKGVNDTIMNKYYRILQLIKEQYLERGTIYFERDYKDDGNDPFALHSFICDKLSFYLECDLLGIMQIHYDFDDFRFEAEVRKLLCIPINTGKCLHKPKQPNLPAFFQGVQNHQDKQYIKTL